MIGIYKITSPTSKVYIGQGVDIIVRWNQYKKLYKKLIGPKLYNSLHKYGPNKHKFEIIEECGLKQLNEREIYWKKYYLGLVNNDWSKVLFCELHDKGGGPRSESTKQKLKNNRGPKHGNYGKKFSKVTKQKISKSKKGKKFTEQHKLKLRVPKGPMDENTKIKLSKSQRGISKIKNKKPIIQMNINNIPIQEWPSQTEASLKLKIKQGDISSVLHGRQITAGGFKFKFVKND